MKIELTDEQAQEVTHGRSVEVVDPASAQTFVVLPREKYEQVQALLEKTSDRAAAAPGADVTSPVSPGIRRSQEAYWRDLPALLKLRSRKRQWVAYHGDQRVGFGRTSAELYRECIERHGLKKEEFYVDRLEPRSLPPWEAEVIDAPFPWSEAPAEPPDAPA